MLLGKSSLETRLLKLHHNGLAITTLSYFSYKILVLNDMATIHYSFLTWNEVPAGRLTMGLCTLTVILPLFCVPNSKRCTGYDERLQATGTSISYQPTQKYCVLYHYSHHKNGGTDYQTVQDNIDNKAAYCR